MNAPPILTGAGSGPTSPDYNDFSSKDITQERTNAVVPQSSGPVNRGVILAKDSLDVPLEVQFGINNDRADSSRPTLMPLFRTRYVDDHAVTDLTQDYYTTLRNSLPQALRDALTEDEAQIIFADRDPDLIALNTSLQFEANLLATADLLAIPGTADEGQLLSAQQYLALPYAVQQEFLNYGSIVLASLNEHLTTIGSNDPSYEILRNVGSQIQETMGLLSQNRPVTPSTI